MTTVLAAVPEKASGPGWSNCLIWIYYRDDNGNIAQTCLQPDQWGKNAELAALFNVAMVSQSQMTRAVQNAWEELFA